MTAVELSLALLVLLLTPGPTNTLVMLAGAERGFWPAMRLVPVELVAYLSAVLPFLWLGAAFPAQAAAARPVVAMLAGVWVLRLAWVMWHVPAVTTGVRVVTAVRLFVTTLLNPKAVIMGVALLPAATEETPRLAILSVLIVAIAAVWAMAGCSLPGAAGGGGMPPLLRRAIALWLAGVSVMIVAGGLRA
jgi:threonine/homoserine/homoserine lactone efflux protein